MKALNQLRRTRDRLLEDCVDAGIEYGLLEDASASPNPIEVYLTPIEDGDHPKYATVSIFKEFIYACDAVAVREREVFQELGTC